MGSTRGEPAPLCLDFCNALLALSMLNQSPGRFFAANELKAMLAYIVLNYDLKIDGDGPRPANIYYATGVIPAINGQVLFRKRTDVKV